LQSFARNLPVTAVVDAIRGLLLGGPIAPGAWRALAWSLAVIVASAALARLPFARRTS
jgi:ABC-2 type transport system permease protein